MKTKSESKFLEGSSSESWRNTSKGVAGLQKAQKPKSGPLFRIAGYVRLSPTAEERDEGSLVSHPQRIRQFVESKNIQNEGTWGEIVEWYTDKDFSGKDMNRPAFQRMLADIQAGHVNAVVVTELSRLSRYVKDFCEIYEFFKEHRVAFFSLRESFDTSTPAGELMLMQSIAFAQFERQTIVDRIKKGARARAERGLANGYIPLGFKAVEHKPNYREVNEEERTYVEMIFRKFLELKKLNHLMEYLNDGGFRTKEFVTKAGKKSGGNRWTLGSLHAVLTNRAYIGEREVNKRFRGADQSTLKDEERYFYVDAHWPALISEELFYDVQRLMEQNRKKARKYIHEYRLTGLIHCSECGAQIVGKSGTGKNGKYFYYGHKRKVVVHNDRHLHRCKVENISAPMLEEAVIARLKDLSDDHDLLKELARASSSESQAKLEHQKSLLAAKEQERRRIEQKLNNLYESIAETDDKLTRKGLSSKAAEVQVQLEQTEIALVSMKAEYESHRNVVNVESAYEYLKIFKNGAFDSQPLSVQAEILRLRIRRIVVQEDGVTVEIYGRKPEALLLGSERGKKINTRPDVPIGGTRSGVRTDSKMVALTRQLAECPILLIKLTFFITAVKEFLKKRPLFIRKGCRFGGSQESWVSLRQIFERH